MRVGVLVTNGGSHDPEKWAEETAAQIADVIVIDPSSIAYDSLAAEKTKFEQVVEASLVEHHDTVQSHEKDAIDKQGHKRLEQPLDPEQEHLDDAVAAVLEAADKTMFAAHFRKPEVVAFVRSTLHSHFSTVRQIERSWHADKNPNTPQAAAFRSRFHG